MAIDLVPQTEAGPVVGRSIRDATEARPAGRVYFAPVLCVALVLRVLAAVSAAAAGDPRLWFYKQASEYGCLAQSLLSGHGFGSPFCGNTGPSAFLAPGYPMLVAAAFHVFGPYSKQAAAAIIAAQTIFGVTTVLLLMLLARRFLGGVAANVAGALCAVSPAIVLLPILFWETSLSILLLTGVFVVALYCVDRPQRRNWVGFGLYCALAMFVNPALLLTFAAVLAWAAFGCKGAARSGPALAAVVWCVVFSIWPIRNAMRLHAFVPLRTNLGYELWQGNRPGSDGSFSLILHPNASVEEYRRYAALGEVAYMREKSALAMAAIHADRTRFLRLSVGRLGKFWLNTRGYKESVLLTVEIQASTLLGLFGLGLSVWRRPRVGWLLAVPFILLPAPYYLTHADFRFRLLLEPLALMLSASVVLELMRWLRVRRRGTEMV